MNMISKINIGKILKLAIVLLSVVSLFGIASAIVPVANFTSNVTSGIVPFDVQFNDTSSDTPTEWSWFFGDETYTNGWVRQNNSVGSGRFGMLTLTTNNGSIVSIGGFDTAVRNYTRMSVDKGLTWTNTTGTPGWVARYYLTGGRFSDNTIIILGGYDGANARNDTWTSIDNGTTWTLVNSSPGWLARTGATSVILPDDSVVLMGGYPGGGSTVYNDVWRSTDKGSTWVRQNSSAGWTGRYYLSSVALSDDSIIITGGTNSASLYKNDTWLSTNKGVTWTNITSNPGWAARYHMYLVAMPDNTIVLMGGQSTAGPPFNNDTWISKNKGATWTLTNLTAGWIGRTSGGSTVLPDGSIIILGGRTSTSAASGQADAWRMQPVGSSIQNATHTYTVVGVYNVGLTSANTEGYNTTTKLQYINALGPPVTNFISNTTIGTMYPYVVQFNDTTSDAPSTWNWSFGDGRWFNTTSSALRNVTYTYAVAGKYDVSLITNNSIGANITTKTQYINLTSDNDANLTSWLHMNNSFAGEKGVAWTVNGNAQISNSIFKYGGGSGWFPGATNDYVSTPSSSAFNFSTGDFTIEMWVNVTSVASANDHIISKTNNARNRGWGLDRTDSAKGDSGWDFWMGNDSQGQVFFNAPIPNKTWNHIVVERQSGIIYLYINGNLTNSSAGFNANYDTIDPVWLGRQSGQYYNGYIDEFRITKGLARWNANFTPPYNEYRGTLETLYPDINPNSTMRYKTNPGGNASISNTTPRNRTIQIENVYNTSYVIGTATFDPMYFQAKAVRLNETYFPTGMVLISSNIDNTLGEVSFNVSRPEGFNAGTNRASIIDYETIYWNYSDPSQPQEFFGSGYLLNGTTNRSYPIHNFISTNVTLLAWNITVNFTANNLTTPTGINVNFTDDSYRYDSYPNQWNWSFGDGEWNNGTNQTVFHPYTSGGLKTVTLIAGLWQNNSINASSTKINYINVIEYPIANFTSNVTSGFAPTPVQFNDTTPNSTTSWNWSFRNVTGNNTEIWFSTDQNATQVFNVGNFSIKLNASNSIGYNITPGLYFINVSDAPLAPVSSFTSNTTSGYSPLPVLFNDTSTNTPTSWNWSFRNVTGNDTEIWFSTNQNITQIFNVGNFSIKLNASNSVGYNITPGLYFINVSDAPLSPISSFTSNTTFGYSPLAVLFNDTSTNTPTSWNWSFRNITGNNTEVWFSTDQNATQVFNVGNFSIKLNASNSVGFNITPGLYFINVSAAPLAPVSSFISNTTSGYSPLPVLFNDTSINAPTSWNWSFRNVTGNDTEIWFSTDQNATQVFNVGNFSIKLNTSNSVGFNITPGLYFINVSYNILAPIADFTSNVTTGYNPLAVQFTDTSLNSPTGWAWYFGDELYDQTWVRQNNSVWGTAKRSGASAVTLLNGNIIVTGGIDTATRNNTLMSADKGVTWTNLSTTLPGWSGRYYHSSVRFSDNSILIMGGLDTTSRNDSWRSTDSGVTWTLMNASSGWGGRNSFSAVVLQDDSVVIMGGVNTTSYGDVWRSTDKGATWVRQNSSPGWSARSRLGSAVMPDGSIILIGGFNNDTWKSTDKGVTWSLINSSCAWIKRNSFATFAMPDGSIMITAGIDDNGIYLNDSWRSKDQGNIWIPINAIESWTARRNPASTILPDGSVVIMGGATGPAANTGTTDAWRFQPVGSSLQNPSHLYTTAGIYNVSLTAFNSGGYNTTIKTFYTNVTISYPIPDFTSNVTSGIEDLTVEFWNTSTSSDITSWNWSFGDNNFSTSMKPIYVYENPGNYSVSLNVTNSSGYNSTTYTDYIWVQPRIYPDSNFTANITSGAISLTVEFTNTSTNSDITAWNWSFGDGNYSTTMKPIYVYENTGTYDVSLNVTNSSGFNTTIKIGYITATPVTPVVADFTSNVTTGEAPLTVQFIDMSTGFPTSWAWDVQNDGTNESFTQNYIYTYNTPGLYSVKLTASKFGSGDFIVKPNYIDVTPAIPPLSVTNLTATGINCTAISFTWNNPPDGDFLFTQLWLNDIYIINTSTPSYLATGLSGCTSYTLSTRTIDNRGNMNMTWVNVTRATSNCPPPPETLIADFTIAQSNVCIPSHVVFTSNSYSLFGITNYYWNISDGGGGVDFTTPTVNINYVYDGSYTINLTVRDTTGNTSTKIRTVSTVNCSVGPTPTPTKEPGNVSQPQPSAQTAGNYTDIRIWAIMFIGCLTTMILSRDTAFRTIRPAIFGMISFILGISTLWFSLSIAYMGDFGVGAIVEYTNQTSQQVYYYQVIQVVASPVISMICLVILIFVVLNMIDIGMNYIQRGDILEAETRDRNKERFGDKIRSVGGEIRKPERSARRETRGRIKK
jgi:PKD repeat protein